VSAVSEDFNPVEMVGREPDDRLLGEDLDKLPAAVGRPEEAPPSRVRRHVVGTGATLTGVSLVVGVLLALVGVVDGFINGLDLTATLAFLFGVLLIGTHWGWVHVAELTANTIEGRANADVLARQQQWLAALEPYPRVEVSTSVEDDGSISIVSVRHRPVLSGARAFTFVREVEHREVHSGDEPAAEVTERAEHLRREAALATERERERYEVAADAYQAALTGRADEEQRRLARRAASEALSRQINTNLREPPLVE
jgi:hypothetical protein